MRQRILSLAHDKSCHFGVKKTCRCHFGVKKTCRLIKRSFLWPNMGKDVTDFVRFCDVCQRTTKANPAKGSTPDEGTCCYTFYERVAIDIVEPFPKGKRGVWFLLTYLCLASQWPEAVPLRSIIVDALVGIFVRNGFPLEILSDQGSQLTGSMVQQLCETLAINKVRTTPYRPQANGAVERMHGTLIPMLRKAASKGVDWVSQLPLALYAMRLAPHETTGVAPFAYVHGSGWISLGTVLQ